MPAPDLTTLAGQRAHYAAVMQRTRRRAADDSSRSPAPPVVTDSIWDIPVEPRFSVRSEQDNAHVLSFRKHQVRLAAGLIAMLIEAAALHFGVAPKDILSRNRCAHVVRPRQIAMFLAREVTARSLPETARLFGGRDHTTVLHAERKIGAERGVNPRLACDIAAICAAVGVEVPA